MKLVHRLISFYTVRPFSVGPGAVPANYLELMTGDSLLTTSEVPMFSSRPPIINVYVGLGSNLGDRAGNLLLAVRGLMAAELDVTRLSAIYETEPVGTFAQPSFLNMVVELRGNVLPPPAQLLTTLLGIEQSLGRTREVPLGPRTIDLDLLIYSNEVRSTQFLTLPHPRLHQRRFVLEPLAELCPQLVHPTLQRTIRQLLDDCADHSEVKSWPR